MHYYSFNIGDYASHTRHLTANEDLAYRRLLDLYYLHEQPLNSDLTVVARAINMRFAEDEVEQVLKEFFQLVDGKGWVNSRADEEIAKYHGKLEAASRAGKASAEKRLNARSTDVQLNKKQETINNNQETIRLKTKTTQLIIKPDDVSVSTWQDFLQIRKAKKAPLTASAIKGIEREAAKAGFTLGQALTECCVRGWAGFKSEWVNKDQGKKTQHQINQEGIARSLGLIPKGEQFRGTVIEGEVYDADATTTPKRLG